MNAKAISIIDENRFTRICSAILELEGYTVSRPGPAKDIGHWHDGHNVGLIITSYPFCKPFAKTFKSKKIPTIVLSDYIDQELIDLTKECGNSCFMLKPLDYKNFTLFIHNIMTGDVNALNGGYYAR